MTTVAGPRPHHLRAGPAFDAGAFALAAVGLLLSASLLVGGPVTVPTGEGATGHGAIPTVAATRPVAPTTATAVAAVPTPAVAAPAVAPTPVAAAAAPAATTAPPVPPPAFTTGCADALAFLAGHQAPGFVDTCAPGSALGHYGYTCATVPGRCDGVRIIHIACPAPFVYMNEAHNSWTLIGQGSGIDPYGQGNAAERVACDRYR